MSSLLTLGPGRKSVTQDDANKAIVALVSRCMWYGKENIAGRWLQGDVEHQWCYEGPEFEFHTLPRMIDGEYRRWRVNKIQLSTELGPVADANSYPATIRTGVHTLVALIGRAEAHYQAYHFAFVLSPVRAREQTLLDTLYEAGV